MKNRIFYLDRLKGFAIFLVVIGHVIQNNVVNPYQNPIFELIYSFHMPFFFFLSGYIAEKTTQIESVKNFFTYIEKKAIALLIPLFTWPFVTSYFFTSNSDVSLITFLKVIQSQIASPSLWFLKTLFEILVVYSIFNVISTKLNDRESCINDMALLLLVIILTVVIGSMLQSLTFMSFLLNLIFFFVGVFVSKFQLILKIIQNKTVFFSSGFLFMTLVGHYNFSEMNFVEMKALKIAVSLFAIILFYNLSKILILPNRIDYFLQSMGKSTIVIYVSHFAFLSILPKEFFLPADLSVFLLGVIVIPISIILIFLCMFLGKIAETMPALNLLMFGKRLNK